jgi:AcrR family transcriptional regulator
VPKIIGGSLAEHRDETRRLLFAALAALMEERGFDAISLADIAQEAGVGRTAIYNHVADKESLLIDYINDQTERYLASLRQALDGVADPIEQLRLYVRYQLEFRRTFHMPAGLREAVSPASRARLRAHAEPVEAVLRGILSEGIASGAFVAQPIEASISLINACLIMRGGRPPSNGASNGAGHATGPAGHGTGHAGHAAERDAGPGPGQRAGAHTRDAGTHAIEAFVLRAVGAVST